MSLPHNKPRWASRCVMAAILLLAAAILRADTLESTAGKTIEGKIIAHDAAQITMEVKIGENTLTRHFPLRFVRAITIDGKREVISGDATPAPAPTPPPGPAATPGPTAKPAVSAPAPAGPAQKSRKEVEDLIQQAGKTPPDWLDATTLNIPQTLDLSFPAKPPPPWSNQKNVGQYVWDVTNPNPGRWREGVKLMYQLLDLHKNDPEVRGRVAAMLGGMFHHLLGDYARAAYWFRQSSGQFDQAALAECYWKLGNKPMAIEELNKMQYVGFSAIKLWADLGDTDHALKVAAIFAKNPGVDEANVLAGDACRMAGRTAEAIKYYESVLATPEVPRNRRPKNRARASLEAIKLFDQLDLKKIPDGVYTDSSMGYETQVEVEVTVTGHRIADVKVTKHHEKQFYASLTETPARIIQKQSVKDIDATSRATITSEAIINATAKALHGAMK